MGRTSAGLYTWAGEKYLAIYNYQHDVSVRLPKEFESSHLAHFSYLKGGKKGGVDVFSWNGQDVSSIIKVGKTFEAGFSDCRIVEEGEERIVPKKIINLAPAAYDIQAELIHSRSRVHNPEKIYFNATADIADFCGDKIAKKPRGHSKKYVDKIVPKTKIRKLIPGRLLTGGKQWFVPECILEANWDPGKGCISAWIPGDNASFDSKNGVFKGYYSYPWGECEYCYAERQHKSFPKNIFEFDKKRMLEELKGDCRLEYGNPKKTLGRPVKVLRFGKRVESWTPFTQDAFIQTLEACAEVGTKPIIPTKFLPYRKDLEVLLKKSDARVLYSIGFDELERGAVFHGCDNEFRLNQAAEFSKRGVFSALYLLMIAHNKPTERDLKTLEFASDKNLPVQLLPMRYNTNRLALKVTGKDFLYLKGTPLEEGQMEFPFFEDDWRSHESLGGNTLVPVKIHEDWLKVVGDNKGKIRMCHHTSDSVYCGNCFQDSFEK